VGDRRPMGGLEEEVMDYLWAVGESTTPSQVHRIVAPELAYTTVMTVMSRLFDKGRLIREPLGRSYAYAPAVSEAEHRAGEMASSLVDAEDRGAVLSRFVDSLNEADSETLRSLLEDD